MSRFLTPSELPEGDLLLIVRVPDESVWIAALIAALMDLELEKNWQQVEGGLTVSEVIEEWRTRVREVVDLPTC